MEFKKVENESGLSLHITIGYDENKEPEIFWGGFEENLSWDEYLDMFTEKYQEHVKLVRKAIEENGLLGFKGKDAQPYYFEFSDGEIWGYTCRAWGDLMQAIINKREGYIRYFM